MLDLRSPLGAAPAALQGPNAAPGVAAGTPPGPQQLAPARRPQPADSRTSMDSMRSSPSKQLVSRPSPQFVSYRRFCRERSFGMRSASSARLKVRVAISNAAAGRPSWVELKPSNGIS